MWIQSDGKIPEQQDLEGVEHGKAHYKKERRKIDKETKREKRKEKEGEEAVPKGRVLHWKVLEKVGFLFLFY